MDIANVNKKFLERNKEWNEEVSDTKIWDEFKIFLRGKLWGRRNLTKDEFKKYKEEFLIENTNWLDEEQKENFIGIVDGSNIISDLDLKSDNIKELVESGWDDEKFREALIRKWVNLYETSTEREERLKKEEAQKQAQTEPSESQPTENSNYPTSSTITPEWNLTFTENWKPKEIQLSDTERKLAQNEGVRENIVNFYKTLESVWLSKLWPHRQDIFKWIQNLKPEFKANNFDYLNENETKIFLNAILKSTWRKEILLQENFQGFLEETRQQNSENLLWKVEEVTAMHWWRSGIEQDFLDKFFPEWSFIFKFQEFSDSIKQGNTQGQLKQWKNSNINDDTRQRVKEWVMKQNTQHSEE
jgi:hypothetical protein